MNLEVREDQTDYRFAYSKVVNDLPVNITNASYRILGTSGSVFVSATNMDIIDNTASAVIDFSVNPGSNKYDRGRNYRFEMTIDGQVINQFFNIVRYPFVNLVNDEDLIDENDYLASGVALKTGQANSVGNTDATILIDSNRVEADAYWQGGEIKIFPLTDTNPITEHQVTNYLKAGGIIYFDPPRSTAPTTERYSIRRSYQKMIDIAGDRVKEHIQVQNEDAYLLIDSTQVNRLIVLKAIANFFQVKRKEKDDEYDIQFQFYTSEYEKLFASINLMFDEDDSGAIDPVEQNKNFTVSSLVR